VLPEKTTNSRVLWIALEVSASLLCRVPEADIQTWCLLHRFSTATDLAYPPDIQRFLNYLGETVHAGIAYCEALGAIAVGRAAHPDFNENLIDLAFKAGQTDFKYITREEIRVDLTKAELIPWRNLLTRSCDGPAPSA
jgi:hypothetical protein